MSVQVEGQRAPLHPVLRRLFNEQGREGAARANTTEFLADDAYVVANIKDGESRVCILAHLLSGETERSDEEVRTWVEQQPPRPRVSWKRSFMKRRGPEPSSRDLYLNGP